jgi:hypothetical protein
MTFGMVQITMKCACGHPRATAKVFVTSLGELALTFKCYKCGTDNLVRLPLEAIIRNLPPHPTKPTEVTEQDMKFLRDAHIRLMD